MKNMIIDTGDRFVINHCGVESFLAYRLSGEVLDLYNAFVPELMKGKGFASELILYGIHYAAMNGYRIKPSHPAVIRFLKVNKEWQYLSVFGLN
jgi:predicted GNAT family acetyltransferase